MYRPMFEVAMNPQRSKQHVAHMVVLQCKDFCKHYSSMPILMDNQHRLYIVVLVLYRLECNLCMDHQRVQVSIYTWLCDYQHGIELLAHNCKDLDSVH